MESFLNEFVLNKKTTPSTPAHQLLHINSRAALQSCVLVGKHLCRVAGKVADGEQTRAEVARRLADNGVADVVLEALRKEKNTCSQRLVNW